MTEGAKTGTPSVIHTMKETAKYYHQRADEVRNSKETTSRFNYMLAQAQVYEQCACLAEDSLTEALKVAGEDKRDAERYRFLRDAACRDHKHHTQQSFSVAKAGWADKLNPEKKSNNPFWLHKEMTGEALDAEVDAALERIRNNKH